VKNTNYKGIHYDETFIIIVYPEDWDSRLLRNSDKFLYHLVNGLWRRVVW
jgi:hypothetical protein